MEPLSYEKELLRGSVADDCLFVHASGLSLDRLLLMHLQVYCTPATLTFVINTNEADEAYLIEMLEVIGVDDMPKVINGSVSIPDRKAQYARGGVQFVTSRILINDLLMNRVPVDHLAAIVVCRAEKLLYQYQETFILRLYRQMKEGGLVKAFTDRASTIADGGLGRLQHLFARLYIRQVHLVPRFEDKVKRELDASPAALYEVNVNQCPPLASIAECLSHLITISLRELKQSTASMTEINDTRESTADDEGPSNASADVDAAVVHESWLERELRRQDNLPEKVVRLSTELRDLRQVLLKCEQMDAVTVYHALKAIKDSRQMVEAHSGWMFTTTFNKMIASSRRSVGLPPLDGEKVTKKWTPTPPSRWHALKEICDEIMSTHKEYRKEQLGKGETLDEGNVMMVCGDEIQHHDLLTVGIDHMWARQMQQIRSTTALPDPSPIWPVDRLSFINHRVGAFADLSTTSIADRIVQQRMELKKRKKGKSKEKQTTLDSYVEDSLMTESNIEAIEKVEAQASHVGWLVTKLVGERYQLQRALRHLQPSYIILINVDLALMRMLEVYAATLADPPRIYLVMLRGSTEELRYLSSVRHEQRAFETLIRESALLLPPRVYDVSRALPIQPTQRRTNTRRGGGRVEEEEPVQDSRILVDMREFNSQLPLVIYERGIDIVPLTLEVGDYVLCMDVCVERKSHEDLSQSLANGRLHSQCEQMLRHYEKYVLIEGHLGGTHKEKRKIGKTAFSGELSKRARELRGYICTVTRLCPTIRFLWSGDANTTAQLFEQIKIGAEEPSEEQAMAARSNENPDDSDAVNVNALRMMLKLPRMTETNARRAMSSRTCLLDVIRSRQPDDNITKQCIHVFNLDFRPTM